MNVELLSFSNALLLNALYNCTKFYSISFRCFGDMLRTRKWGQTRLLHERIKTMINKDVR